MKDRTGAWSKEAQKAAGDSIRRLPIFKSMADRLGGGRLMGEGGGALDGIKGLELSGAREDAQGNLTRIYSAKSEKALRQADRYLRVIDDIMSEYWYTPEGPYRDRLLKDAQENREKAIKLIEQYGASSEVGKVAGQQLEALDKEIEKAGGKVSKSWAEKRGITLNPPGTINPFSATNKSFNSMVRPKSIEDFEERMASLPTRDARERYYNKWYKDSKNK